MSVIYLQRYILFVFWCWQRTGIVNVTFLHRFAFKWNIPIDKTRWSCLWFVHNLFQAIRILLTKAWTLALGNLADSLLFSLTLALFYLTRPPDSFSINIQESRLTPDSVEPPARHMPESLRNQRHTLAIRPIHALSQRHAASPTRRICLVFQSFRKLWKKLLHKLAGYVRSNHRKRKGTAQMA